MRGAFPGVKMYCSTRGVDALDLWVGTNYGIPVKIICRETETEKRMKDIQKSAKPAPEKLEALRSLPKEVVDTLTKDEIQAFLHEEFWPDSLKKKLQAYMIQED